MRGYTANIEELTLANESFRKVLYTAQNVQIVLMSLAVGEEIGMEVHEDGDQFFRFEEGEGSVSIDGVEHVVGDGDVVIVPAGAEHNVVNTSSDEALKLYTLYCPPHHKDGTVHATRDEAMADDEQFDGATSEPLG